jgi:hypothetical protein
VGAFGGEQVREDEDKLKQVQMPVWAHDPSDAPSGTSFRGGNYDLLRRLATFKAIQQLSKEWRRAGGREEEVKADYLDRMLTVHGTNFQGDGPYHIDQAFFEVPCPCPPLPPPWWHACEAQTRGEAEEEEGPYLPNANEAS